MSVFQSFALLLVGGFGAWIAFQQWRTARDKLRLDLFERRSAVVQALREFLRDVTPNGQPTADATIAFHEAIEQGRFLFGDELLLQAGGDYVKKRANVINSFLCLSFAK